MSIRQGLLALLDERPMYGYQLRQEFENRTGGTWPLNIGQVYTTLNRLQRDGLVVETDRREDGSLLYALTEVGRAEAARWWVTPVERGIPSRDELAIKVALAVTADGVDVATVVQRQRAESLRALQEYTRLKARVPIRPGRDDLAWLLVLDSLIFATEAEVRWLDHTEQRLATSLPAQQHLPRPEGNVAGAPAAAHRAGAGRGLTRDGDHPAVPGRTAEGDAPASAGRSEATR